VRVHDPGTQRTVHLTPKQFPIQGHGRVGGTLCSHPAAVHDLTEGGSVDEQSLALVAVQSLEPIDGGVQELAMANRAAASPLASPRTRIPSLDSEGKRKDPQNSQ
jgi:hypothetical protein